VAFSALTLLVGWQEGHLARKKIWAGWWRWALVSPDGVVPILIVSLSASVNLTLHHKVQKFSSGTGSPWWWWKKAVKWLWWWCAFTTEDSQCHGQCHSHEIVNWVGPNTWQYTNLF